MRLRLPRNLIPGQNHDGTLYDRRRHRDIPDNRGGREIVPYESTDRLETRQINLEQFRLPVENP